MSHELSINKKGEAEMFSGNNEVPWHGLGTVVAGQLIAKQAIKAAKLDWEVFSEPIITQVGQQPVEGFMATVRKDSKYPLGIVKNRYEIVQNSEAFEFFDNVVGAGQAVYDTAGALYGGRRIWIMAKLPKSLFIDGREKDEIERRVLLYTSHDGSVSLSMQVVATRVVCWNTLSAALSGAQNCVKIRHTKNATNKIEEAQHALKIVHAYYDKLDEVLNVLNKQEMNDKDMGRFTKVLLPTVDDKEASKRIQNMRDDLVVLFGKGKGNLGQSRWDALNAVTEFVDHQRSTRGGKKEGAAETRFISSQFGSGAILKNRAFDLLVTSPKKAFTYS